MPLNSRVLKLLLLIALSSFIVTKGGFVHHLTHHDSQKPLYFLSSSNLGYVTCVTCWYYIYTYLIAWASLVAQGKESSCSAGDPGSIPGSEDPLEKG